MKLINPIVMTDAQLNAVNVNETDPGAYSAGTMYSIGDSVSVIVSASEYYIYEALASGNVGHTPASSPTWWQYVSNRYQTYSAGTTYGLGSVVQIETSGTHRIYQSLQTSNLGHAPASSPTWWVDAGPTNAWAMFDQSNSSQTLRKDLVYVQIKAADRVNAVMLANVSALSAHLYVTDTVDGLVYEQIVSLSSEGGIIDYYEWFFAPCTRKSDYVFINIPPYYQPTITLFLTDTGNTVALGAFICGLAQDIGGTQYGASVRIQDYSVKTVDAFGISSVTERAYAKRGNFTIQVDNTAVDEVQRLLASYRATPIAWIGDDTLGSTMMFGFYKDFSITIQYPTISICNLEIEGLT